jgi:hypothetical protein
VFVGGHDRSILSPKRTHGRATHEKSAPRAAKSRPPATAEKASTHKFERPKASTMRARRRVRSLEDKNPLYLASRRAWAAGKRSGESEVAGREV